MRATRKEQNALFFYLDLVGLCITKPLAQKDPNNAMPTHT